MLSNLNHIPNNSAPDVLFDFLVGLEAPKRAIYPDAATPSRPTIGVGFNLTIPATLDAVLSKGFGFDLADPTSQDAIDRKNK